MLKLSSRIWVSAGIFFLAILRQQRFLRAKEPFWLTLPHMTNFIRQIALQLDIG